MPELLVLGVILGFVFSPQLLAGFLAQSMGRSFWQWFGLSFLLPVISIFILIYLKDKDPSRPRGYKLADHVKKREPVD